VERHRGVWWGILATAGPLYVTMIASSAAALVDTALLGHVATASLAAFAVAIAVFNPVMSTMQGAERGVLPFVAAHKDDPQALLPVVRNAMWLGYAVGALGALVVAAVPLIGAAAGAPKATLDHLGVFPLLLVGSVVATALGTTTTSVLIGLGQARKVMWVGLLNTGTGVALSLLLVRGVGPVPALGLTGAGIAMLTSTVVARSAAKAVLMRHPAMKGLRLRPGRPDPREVRRLAGVGIPLAGTVLVKFAVMGVLTFAAARRGTADAGVQIVCVSLSNVMYTAAIAVGQAVVRPVALAARDRDGTAVRGAVRAGMVLALAAAACFAVVLVLLSHRIVPVFSTDPSVLGRVVRLLPLVLAAVATDSLQAVAGFGLVGLKRSLPSLRSTLVWFGLLGLLAVPIANAGGLSALWGALIAANALQAASKAVLLRRYSALSAAPVREPEPATR
jgi:multidrug resistance protein, MATE family